MGPTITRTPEKATRIERIGSSLRRLFSRRATPKSSMSGLKSPEAAPVVVLVGTEKTKEVAVLNVGEGASTAGTINEGKHSHEDGDGDVDGAEDKKKKGGEGDSADDVGGNDGIDAGNDSCGDSGDDTGNDTDGSNSTKGREASGPLPNFWEMAWDSDEVGKDRRNLLQSHLIKPAGSGEKPVTAAAKLTSQQALVDDVIQNTQQRMSRYIARWGDDEDYKTTLGVVRSILVSAHTAKKVLDSVLQFDPTGYGSTAWAVVSFGLTLVQNDKVLMDLTFEACGYLADLMARYARIEAHYRESPAKRDKPLEQALVGVYIAILVYAAEVQKSNAAKSWTRLRQSIMSLTGQPLENLKEEINNQDAKLEQWQKVVDRERGAKDAEMLKSIETDTNELLERVDKLAKDGAEVLHGVQTEDLRELWKWLLKMERESQSKIHKIIENEMSWWTSPGDDEWKSWSHRRKTKGKKHMEIARFKGSHDGDGESTTTDEDGSENDDDDEQVPEKVTEDKGQGDEFGGWLFQRQEYIDWIKYPQSLLWLHGSSNCGKSALCAAIIKDLEDTIGNNNKTQKLFAYWHFRIDIDNTKSLNLMLASLFRQLASKCDDFRDDKSLDAFRRYRTSGDLPTDTKQLLQHLKRFIRNIEKDIFLVFDGIDQVPERQFSRNSGRNLLDIIKSLAHKGYPNLHILVVSRDEKNIRLYFEQNMQEMLVSVDVRQGLSEALDTLINRKLDSTAMADMLDEDQDLKEKIKERLRHDGKASNFLWASSVLSQVIQCRDAKEIEQALGKIPDSINEWYQTALSNVAEKDKDHMKRILLWLRWGRRHLSQAEFAAAANIPSPAVVTEICSRVLIETDSERIMVAGQSRLLETFRFTHFSVQEYLDTVFAQTPGALDESTKITRFLPSLGEYGHLQITRRCLDILSACNLSQKSRRNATGKTGSNTGWDHGVGATSDSDDASQHTGASDNSDASGADDTDTDFEEDRRSISTGSSAANGGCPEEPARRYAAEYWFRHYVDIDREKATKESPDQLSNLESDICSQVLGDTHKMRFWLRTHDPDGGLKETIPSPVYYALKLDLKGITMRLITQIAKVHADAVDQRAGLLDQPGAQGTALQLAAHRGDLKVLEELIKNKANVNSKKGPHGTAVYASAARGDRDMVEKLLRADANVDGEDHGDLGSPLHVAAFKGHNAIVELLIEEGSLAVDQPASPFGTALQAASTAMQSSTVKLLLDKEADPNFVGGCLGTAAQAAYAYDEGLLHQSDTVIEELWSRGAHFLHTPSFWRMAYEKATSQRFPMRRYPRARGRSPLVSEAYEKVLRDGSQLPEVQLGDQQELLASVISQWTLPKAQFLRLGRLSLRLASRVPFQDQIDAIRRAAPQHEADFQHLCHSDFMYKACFWAGINGILGKLPRLVDACLGEVYPQLRDGHTKGGEYANTLREYPLRWAFDGFGHRPSSFEDDPWATRRPELGRLWPWGNHIQAMMSYMDRSDLIAMELMQQRQRQRPLEDIVQSSPFTNRAGRGRDEREGEMRQALESASHAGVWVTNDVLDLVKNLVECGDRCSCYQDAVENSAATRYREDVEDLTFELFSAVIRLTFVLRESDDGGIKFERLAQPIQLITTVRLRRIKELDAICERRLVPKHACTNAGVEMGSGPKVHEQTMAETIAGQVEQAIEDKLTAVQSGMVRDIQRSIKEEVARLMEETRKDLGQKVRDEVQQN